ncbi:MAG: hypothetical protein JWN84_1870 [Nocardioides sp.]|nr:hypothetical protein [Nocardioides sp.]
MSRTRTLVAVAAALLVVVVAVVVAVRVLGGDEAEERAERARSAGATFDDVVVLAPDDAQRVLWTDWSGIRAEVGTDLTASSPVDEVQDMLDRGFDADLTATTALDSSASTMQESFAFSPATLEWELFTQSERAATLTMRLGGGVSTDDVADALRALGYDEPADAGGTWLSNTDLAISGQVTPELSYIALDAGRGLVFASDQPEAVLVAVDAAAEATSEPVPREVVSRLGTPLSAAAYDATYACSALAMANADADEQAEGEALVAAAGEVNPVTGFGIGAEDDGSVRVALGFETSDQARTNADTRATLAVGPAPGQGGDFADRFTVDQVTAEGEVVVLALDPVEGAFVLSDMSNGPVLFATC